MTEGNIYWILDALPSEITAYKVARRIKMLYKVVGNGLAEETIFEVYPKNINALSSIILFVISIALDKFVAWNPLFEKDSIILSYLTPLSKS